MSKTEMLHRLTQAAKLVQSIRSGSEMPEIIEIALDLDIALLHLSEAIEQVRALPDRDL